MSHKLVVLSGGIGGAKLALGLSHLVPQDQLLIVGNIGDDFEHLGLHVSPDLDTLMYTLSRKADKEKGWGLENETWECMKSLERLGGETWFKLGDNDLATHLERTRRLKAGETLTEITADFCRKFGISVQIVPISNDSLRTKVETANGEMDFQHYFVREKCKAVVKGFRFEGADHAKPNPVFQDALRHPSLKAVVICPSNPFLSIDPILAVQGVREELRRYPVPVIGVSPIVGGDAVKGPTAKILRELGHPVSAATVAYYYRDFLDGFIVDIQDRDMVQEIQQFDIAVEVSNTLMTDLASKKELAKTVLEFSESCVKH